MGGYGSGRWQPGRPTTNNYRALDVRGLQRDGMLQPGFSGTIRWFRRQREVASICIRAESDRVILSYSNQSRGGEWQAMEYAVTLAWTSCHFGGRRAWFLCPARGCGRRVAILYGGSVYVCRHCQKLAYECQRETAADRKLRHADNIRKRLGWPPGIAHPPGGKPRWMHWRTFERLKAAHDGFANAWWGSLDVWVDRTTRRLAGLGVASGDR